MGKACARIFSLVLAAGVSGCALGGQSAPVPGGQALLAQNNVARLLAHAGKKNPLLFVPDNSQIIIYDKNSQQQVGSIQTGIHGPTGMWVNSKGDLYVANSDGGNATVYPLGASQPSVTYGNSGSGPWDIDRCTDGTVYVAAHGANVAVYENGATEPTRFLTDPDADGFYSSACGPQDHVYAAYFSKSTGKELVKKYGPSGKGKPVLLPMQGGYRSPLTVDLHDDVVFANTDDETIEFWAPGGTKPYRQITEFNKSTWVIQYIKFAPDERELWVWVSEEGANNWAYEIDVKSGAIKYTLESVAAAGPGFAVYPADSFP